MTVIDTIIVVVYLVVILAFGWWLSRRQSADVYFVNNRQTPLWLLLFTLISTSIGAGTIIGTVGETYETGISFTLTTVIFFSLSYGLMAWLAPRIRRWADKTRAYTLGDFLAYRFSKRTRILGSGVIICSYLFILAMQFVAFSLLLGVVTNFPFEVALLITGLLTIVYTTLAGIRGVFYTDIVQFFVLALVVIFLSFYAFKAVDLATVISEAPAGHLDIYNYAGPVFFYGAIILGTSFVLISMEYWQRVFAARSDRAIRWAFVGGGALHVVAYILATILGLATVQLVPEVSAPDAAIYHLMIDLLPVGILGLGVAGILAVLMSSIDSIIMIGSTCITKDFFKTFKPGLTDLDLLKLGRQFAFVYGVLALLVAFLIPDIIRLLVSMGQIMLVIAPAVIGGLLWGRPDEKAAFWSIITGFVVTVAVMPFLPNEAFVPGFLVSGVVFLIFSFKNQRSFPVTQTLN